MKSSMREKGSLRQELKYVLCHEEELIFESCKILFSRRFFCNVNLDFSFICVHFTNVKIVCFIQNDCTIKPNVATNKPFKLDKIMWHLPYLYLMLHLWLATFTPCLVCRETLVTKKDSKNYNNFGQL